MDTMDTMTVKEVRRLARAKGMSFYACVDLGGGCETFKLGKQDTLDTLARYDSSAEIKAVYAPSTGEVWLG